MRGEMKIEAPELRLDPERAIEGLDWQRIFGNDAPVEIEIGIGKGRFLLAAAESKTETNFLGVEWANHYLRIAERRAARRGLENVRFARVDARELIARSIPESSVSAVYVFYPDPWPKKRHHKRRFFQPSTLDHLARTMAGGAELHVATDHDEYWSVIEPLLDGDPRFDRLSAFGGTDFPLPVEPPLTNFEAKYEIEGRSRNRASWRRNQAAARIAAG